MACGFTTVPRDHIGNVNWELRHRTSFDACGRGVHTGRHSEQFNLTFWNRCGAWITYINTWAPASFRGVDWVGDIGVAVCKPGFHGQGRAFDLSQIRFTGGQLIDMDADWNLARSCASVTTLRRYIGVAASLRRQVGTVLTTWYNADHQNHIHFDNGVAVGPIQRTLRTDTTLVQATCRHLSGETGVAIDGDWGPITEAAYLRLLTKLRMNCRSPRGNTADALLLLHLIARTGLNGTTAGAFTGPC